MDPSWWMRQGRRLGVVFGVVVEVLEEEGVKARIGWDIVSVWFLPELLGEKLTDCKQG